MGFYGNITNTNRTQFVFDKIYSSRTAMDKAVLDNKDEVFIGRYVLVDYNEGSSVEANYQRLYKDEKYGWFFYFDSSLNSETRALYSEETYYIIDENGEIKINPKRALPEYNNYIFQDQPIYIVENEEYVFYQCTGPSPYGKQYPEFSKMSQAPVSSDPYFNNFSLDRKTYGNSIGRGWDSTVWQKVYTENKEKYVMIAELNSVVPTFGLTVDAPSLDPIAPHFDADTTNVYYRLHVQPTWGLRVAPADEIVSDTYVKNSQTQWDPLSKQNITVEQKYHGAIYYNDDGFDSNAYYDKSESHKDVIDEIKLLPDGRSGQKYTFEHNPDGYNNPDYQKEAPDIQQLTINLPSIGNAISDLWNLVYGNGMEELDEEEITNNKEKKYTRNKNLEWNNTAGLRLVREQIDGSGFTYDPDKQINTIAGCINSVHDLMGMIISTQDEKKQTETNEEYIARTLKSALTNRIYYGNYEPTRAQGNYKGYYIKYLSYDYDESQKTKQIEKVENLKDFSAGKYYYIDNKNYYQEVDKYKRGNNYYTLEGKVHPKALYEKDWEPNVYFYQKPDGTYVLDNSTWPDENKQYFTIEPIFNETKVDSSRNIFFFPTNQAYFDKYFKSTISETPDKDGYLRGSGLFYWDANEGIYKPFEIGTAYRSELYWYDNFVIEKSTDIHGNPVEVYDFQKGATRKIYTMVAFEANKYYFEKPEEEKYYLLQSEADIDISVVYKSFKIDSVEPIVDENNNPLDFYQPGLYYYQEGNDYIQANEKKRVKELGNYYTIDGADAVNEIFYEPNVYYYKDKGEYILDEREKMSDTDYYNIYFLYVIDDPNNIYEKGTKINEEVDLSTIPDLKYGTRREKYIWKELTGFARTLNTIHGLILDLNNLICFDDKLTRDTKTVQGCINTINDIINSIGKLKPSEIMVVDKYGRMVSSPYTTEQKFAASDYPLYHKHQDYGTLGTDDEGWIQLTVDDDPFNPQITLHHKYTPVGGDENLVYDLNANDTTDKDAIKQYTPIVDATGHVVGHNIETVTLPYGYKTIQVKNSDLTVAAANSIVESGQSADNTQDIINFNASNKWIKFDNSEEDIIKIGHERTEAVENANKQFGLLKDIDITDLDTDNTFEVPNFKFDEAGHIIDAQTHTVTIPESFTKINVQGSSNLETDSTSADALIEPNTLTDELTIASGNKWIELKANADNDKIEILHYVKKFTPTSGINVDYNISGNTINLQKLGYDNAGHVVSEETTKYTLPNNYQTIKIANSGIENSNILVAASGDLKANSLIDTAIFDTGNRWIQLIADVENKSVKIGHAVAGTAIATAGDTSALTLEYGGTFNMPYITYDNMGHIVSSANRVITMPALPANTLLTGYSVSEGFASIGETDTINSGLLKLDKRVQDLYTDCITKIEANTDLINNNKTVTDKAIQDNTTLINNNKTAIEEALTEESDRAIAAETEIKGLIPAISSAPAAAGYYVLQVKEDGTHTWIPFESVPPVTETPPTETEPEEPIVPEE